MKFISKTKRFSKYRFFRSSNLYCLYDRVRNSLVITYILKNAQNEK